MKTLLIAEAGLNHCGKISVALDLIDMAKEGGADIVKFQIRSPRDSTPSFMWNIPKETPWGTTEPYIEYREKMELGRDGYNLIDKHARTRGIPWTASVWDIPSVDFLAQYDVPFIKIPSPALTDGRLLSFAGNTGIPLVVSTGMSTKEEVDNAIQFIPRIPGASIMVCHSQYPVRDESELNLKQIHTYAQYGFPVGFSSHSKSPYPAIYASVLGAKSVEVHITLDRTVPTGDAAASLESPGLRLLAREIQRIDKIMGDGEKRLYPSEMEARQKLRGG